MNRVETLTQFYSDVVLGQVNASDAGYAFEEMTVTYAANMAAGAIVKSDGTWAAAADAANAYGVVVDRRANNYLGDLVAGTTYKLVVARRGVTLNKSLLKYSDAAINAAGVTALEAKGIKVTDKVVA